MSVLIDQLVVCDIPYVSTGFNLLFSWILKMWLRLYYIVRGLGYSGGKDHLKPNFSNEALKINFRAG